MPVGLTAVAGRFRDQHLLKICDILTAPLMAEGGWKIKTASAGGKQDWQYRRASGDQAGEGADASTR
jgi:hypothetical protein